VRDRYNTPWRELATALYAPPAEGKIYGTIEVDVTEALDFIDRQRKGGVPLTLTHLMTAALSHALAYDVPEINCFIRRGTVVARPHADVCVVAQLGDGRSLAAIRIRDAHLKSLAEVAQEVRSRVAAHRAGEESPTNRNKYGLSRIPWPLRRPVVRLLSWAVGGLGIELRALGLASDSFGSILLSNIGSLGLTSGMLALFPAARLPAAVAMGRVQEKPVVRDGAIVVRSLLTLTGSFDHRLVDGEQAGKLATSVTRLIEKPEELLKPDGPPKHAPQGTPREAAGES
jgi:pyruvate/2-oxoglutarate dehydrogenase complex dihydrolipoamide acyltransferase (E2) component